VIITTSDEWKQLIQNPTTLIFVVLSEGELQQKTYDAATRQATVVHRKSAWIKQPNAVLESDDPVLQAAHGGDIACTLCRQRHIVRHYRPSDLPEDELDLIADEGYGEAGDHH
jgi:hypothetical protein